MPKKSTIIVNKEEKWYVAKSLELGVVSQGKNIEEAEKNLKEAVKLYLENQPEKRRCLLSSTNIPHISWLDF